MPGRIVAEKQREVRRKARTRRVNVEIYNHKGQEGARRRLRGDGRFSVHLMRVDNYMLFANGLWDRAANRSDQRMRPVACITTNSVMTAMIVIESPVNPRQKNA